MTAEDVKRIERAMGRFNTCGVAGTVLSIEVNRKTGGKKFLGYCGLERKRVDVEPTCRICLRHTKKKKNTSKKTATARARISQGRKREKQRKERAKRLKESSRQKSADPFY